MEVFENILGLLSSGIPLTLKGAIFGFLAALALDSSSAPRVFEKIMIANILSKGADGRLLGLQVRVDSIMGTWCCIQQFFRFFFGIRISFCFTHEFRRQNYVRRIKIVLDDYGNIAN